MVRPAVTGRGEGGFAVTRLADAATVATTGAQLLEGTGSASAACTQASFCSVPLVVKETVATTGTVMDWPGDRVPGHQFRVAGPVADTCALSLHDALPILTVMPAGTESVTLTLVAEDGPELAATMV